MSTIAPISSTTSSSGTDSSSQSVVAQKTLGESDFLTLLAKQFQEQDPLQPTNDTSFIAQMAQFTSLQQSSTMEQTMAQMNTLQQQATANSYLGYNVTVDAGSGNTDVGAVTGIDNSTGTPQLSINGNLYPLSAVLHVEPVAVTTPQPTSTTGGS